MVARNERLEIGEVLRSTRSRLGLDIYTVERETKIRVKYLQASEQPSTYGETQAMTIVISQRR